MSQLGKIELKREDCWAKDESVGTIEEERPSP